MVGIDSLASIKWRLRQLYGERLQGVVLYGSEARGEAGEDSDVDLLVLLAGPVDHWQETKAIIDAIYPMILELGRPVHAKPVDVRDYRAGEFPLYQRAAKEGVAL